MWMSFAMSSFETGQGRPCSKNHSEWSLFHFKSAGAFVIATRITEPVTRGTRQCSAKAARSVTFFNKQSSGATVPSALLKEVQLRENCFGPVIKLLQLRRVLDMAATLEADPPSTHSVCGRAALRGITIEIMRPVVHGCEAGNDLIRVALVHMHDLSGLLPKASDALDAN